MKAFTWVAALGLAAVGTTLVIAKSQEGSPQTDMQNCPVCKYMAENPELMKNMTWETHKIDNGMLCVASVPKNLKQDFEAAHQKMMQAVPKVIADQKAGKPVELCGFCESMSGLMQSGAKQENIDTATGSVCLVTSNDPAVVQKIHACADKAIAEQKSMEQLQTQ